MSNTIKNKTMKTKSIKRTGLCIALACCMLAFTMCKKDSNNNNNNPSVLNQRVTEYKYYMNDTLFGKCTVTYSGNVITELMVYDPGQAEMQKTAIQYSGNSITSVTSYDKHYDTWQKDSMDEVVGYTGDNPNEIIFHAYNNAGNEIDKSRTTYTYSGSLLTKTDDYHAYTGNWELVNSTAYTYDNNGKIVQESDTSDSWGYITTYRYESGRMVESLRQAHTYGTLTNEYRITFEYTNNLMTKSISYEWSYNAWEKNIETSYTYNEFGNLISEQYDDPYYNYSMKIVVTYGAGSGNFRQYLKVMGGENFLPGIPIPYPVKSLCKGLVFPDKNSINL